MTEEKKKKRKNHSAMKARANLLNKSLKNFNKSSNLKDTIERLLIYYGGRYDVIKVYYYQKGENNKIKRVEMGYFNYGNNLRDQSILKDINRNVYDDICNLIIMYGAGLAGTKDKKKIGSLKILDGTFSSLVSVFAGNVTKEITGAILSHANTVNQNLHSTIERRGGNWWLIDDNYHYDGKKQNLLKETTRTLYETNLVRAIYGKVNKVSTVWINKLHETMNEAMAIYKQNI